jgi:hypothetical protein
MLTHVPWLCRALGEQDKHEEAVVCYDLATIKATGVIDGFSPFGKLPSSPLTAEARAQTIEALVGKGISLGRCVLHC